MTRTSSTDSSGTNLANFHQFAISGIKYTDVNGLDGNSNLTGDTAGTPGTSFTINLYDWHDTVLNPGVVDATELTILASTTTDATTGAWSFTSLGPLTNGDKYYVKEVAVAGWTQTYGTAGDIITPFIRMHRPPNNSAIFNTLAISGIKYTEVNGLDGSSAIGGDDTSGTVGASFTINLYDWHDTIL